MKKVVSSLLVSGLIVLAGCGNPQPPAAAPSTSTSASSASAASDPKAITVAGVGGKIEAVVRDYVAPKFTEKTGIKVNFIAGVSGEVLSKVELQKNSPEIDVAMYVPLDVERARKAGLAESLDSGMIPNLAQIDDRYVALDKVGVPVFGYSIAPAYNTKAFETKQIPPIQSWNDIIRPEYKGKTAYSDISNDWGFATLYILAKANGGSMENLEPGLEKAKDLAAYSDTFYKNSTQMIPALQQGIADVTVMGSYTIAQTFDAGVPLKMVVPKEGIPLQASNATIVKNSPNKKAAQDFINFMISEEVQHVVADNGFYPTIKGVKIPDKYIPVIGMKDTDSVYKPDVAKLSESRNMWSERWIKEVNPQLGKKVVK
ncbi:ABC transporter substrate-binding protein [Paenibacillus piri]|uniref:ABC transporter substrate-binding protein n=1 Tax=Paenibacillus piri TaxID=2547395 RepID=A0A4R5K766_9BACL|nr:ABC transporter substrate-binding protein [Paenibacillus piri]TDF89726.1 ABC transporter substrate-binding protein [Paenibacillus piri]